MAGHFLECLKSAPVKLNWRLKHRTISGSSGPLAVDHETEIFGPQAATSVSNDLVSDSPTMHTSSLKYPNSQSTRNPRQRFAVWCQLLALSRTPLALFRVYMCRRSSRSIRGARRTAKSLLRKKLRLSRVSGRRRLIEQVPRSLCLAEMLIYMRTPRSLALCASLTSGRALTCEMISAAANAPKCAACSRL